MASLGMSLLLTGALGVSFDVSSLETQAAATTRPEVCPAEGQRPTVWRRIRLPKLASYCQHMALAQAGLAAESPGAEQSLEAAEAAIAGLPDTARLRGRVLAARGKHAEAVRAFDEASKAGLALGPLALRDFAQSLRKAGELERAVATYRMLVPQAGLLPKATRDVVLLEAAFATMTDAETRSAAERESGLEEALAYLHELRDDPTSNLGSEALLGAALVAVRRGQSKQATGIAAQATVAGAGARVASWVADDADQQALAALAKESAALASSVALWESYLTDHPKGPFSDAARAHLEALKKRAPKAPKTR